MNQLVVALHGYGGSGAEIADTILSVDPTLRVVAPDGPAKATLTASGSAWYPLTSQLPRVARWSVECAPGVVELIRSTQIEHRVAPEQTTVVGFSQGASVAAAVMNHSPVCQRAVLACGRLPDGPPTSGDVLVVTGEDDHFVTASDVMSDVGPDRVHHVVAPGVGHEFNRDVARIAVAFAHGELRSSSDD